MSDFIATQLATKVCVEKMLQTDREQRNRESKYRAHSNSV